MKVTIAKIEPWSACRKSRPWAARLSYDGKLVYNFVDDAFEGTCGDGGTLSMDLEDGDYIAWGQKDFMGSASFMWTGSYRGGVLSEVPKSVIIDSLRMKNEKKD